MKLDRMFSAVGGVTVVAIAVAAFVATTTAGAGSPPSGGRWAWDQGVPGTSDLQLPASGHAAARAVTAISSDRIDPLTLKRVVSAGTGKRALVLIAAQNATGTPCLTIISGGGGRQFSCLDERVGDSAIIRFVMDGGTNLGQVQWVTVVGAVRSDVARLTVLTTNGEERELSLNRWRAFAYAPASSTDFPVSLRAYDSDGSLIEEFVTLA
jgi:hypothetical protein